jgi:hypothetical protein
MSGALIRWLLPYRLPGIIFFFGFCFARKSLITLVHHDV